MTFKKTILSQVQAENIGIVYKLINIDYNFLIKMYTHLNLIISVRVSKLFHVYNV